jgi:hypothetical protein
VVVPSEGSPHRRSVRHRVKVGRRHADMCARPRPRPRGATRACLTHPHGSHPGEARRVPFALGTSVAPIPSTTKRRNCLRREFSDYAVCLFCKRFSATWGCRSAWRRLATLIGCVPPRSGFSRLPLVGWLTPIPDQNTELVSQKPNTHLFPQFRRAGVLVCYVTML